MTKYEYYHNREHKKIFVTKGMNPYSNPVERIILIILINLLIIGIPFIISFVDWKWLLADFGLLCVYLIWTEYNIFYNFERCEYFLYFLIFKKTAYKEFIVFINQYENQVKIENRIGRKLRKSYLNCCKIRFKGKSNGYFTSRKLVVDGKIIDVDFNKFNTKKEIIEFIKNNL